MFWRDRGGLFLPLVIISIATTSKTNRETNTFTIWTTSAIIPEVHCSYFLDSSSDLYFPTANPTYSMQVIKISLDSISVPTSCIYLDQNQTHWPHHISLEMLERKHLFPVVPAQLQTQQSQQSVWLLSEILPLWFAECAEHWTWSTF